MPDHHNIGSRREAREQALLLLYELEARGGDPATTFGDRLEPLDAFTLDALDGIVAHMAELDSEISELATDWPLERLAAIDRALLRLGIWELRHRDDIPSGVTLNEAVRLAKEYGTDDSSRFVNGVLASAARNAGAGTGGAAI